MSYLNDNEAENRKDRWGGLYKAFCLILFLALMVYAFWLKPSHFDFEWRPGPKIEATQVATQNPMILPVKAVKSAKATELAFVTIKSGDTLISLFGKDWRAVCEHNKLADCNQLQVGQKIYKLGVAVPQPATKLASVQSAQAKPAAKPVPVAKAASVKPAKLKATSIQRKRGRDAEGWWHWQNVGGSPMTTCPQDEPVEVFMSRANLSEAEKKELRQKIATSDFEAVNVPIGTRYKLMTFCKNGKMHAEERVVLDDPDTPVTSKRYHLSTGRVIESPDQCNNWAELDVSPPVAELPPPVITVSLPEDVPPTLVPPVKEEEKSCFDWNAVVGVEKELVGGNSLAGWVSGSAYVHCWRGELFGSPGLHEIGGGIKGSAWNGRTDHGRGKYEGSWIQIGPAYQFIADDCWLLEARAPMVGRLNEKFRHNGGYKSKRQFTTLGADVSYNWYAPRCANDKSGIREVQANVSVGIPIGKSGKHSFQGQPIADESDLMKLGLIAQAGVRVYVGGSEKIHPYGDAGTFLETPGSWTGSLRVGVAFGKNRCVGVHAGPNFDLKTGDVAPLAVGAWWDIDCSVKGARENRRATQVSNLGQGQILDSDSGFTMVANDVPPEGEPIGQVLVTTDSANE